MPTAIDREPIAFENNRQAFAVFPPAGATGKEIVAALGITSYKAVLLVIGGAGSVDEKLKSRLTQLFGRGVARAAATMNAVIIDGGTESGVMAMMGQGVADRGFQSALVGVAPLGMVSYPGRNEQGKSPLDPNHSHFVLVEGNAWGNETNVIFKLVSALRNSKAPAVALLAGGGAVTKDEALQAVRQNIPLFIVEGSGGTADEIANVWRTKPEIHDDPVMAEIIADGRIELHPLNSLIRGAELLLMRALGGDNVLLQSWGHFADYDLNALIQQKRFHRLQLGIIVLGIIGTALALTKQVYNPEGVQTALKDWWFYRPSSVDASFHWALTPHWVGWWLIYYSLILIPILLTVLITASNRFKQGNKWLLLRASAEAIKREIFRYRARAGDYKEVPPVAPSSSMQPGQPVSPGTPGVPASPASPQTMPPTPEQVLSQRVEDITRRAMRTELNSSALKPYDKNKGLPPNIYATQWEDDGFTLLSAERYVQLRLGDQLNFFRARAVKHERKLKAVQWSIFVIGGLGSLLAAINRQVWIALTTALAAALTTYLSYQQTESTLTKYNQAATDLNNVKSWWTALPPEEQAKQINVDTLVDHTEQVLQSELDGWVQQMQNALADLRKNQPQAPETPGGTGSAPPSTVAAYAEAPASTAYETAGDQIVGQESPRLTRKQLRLKALQPQTKLRLPRASG